MKEKRKEMKKKNKNMYWGQTLTIVLRDLDFVLRDLDFDLGSKGRLVIGVVDVPWRWWEGENLIGVCECV